MNSSPGLIDISIPRDVALVLFEWLADMRETASAAGRIAGQEEQLLLAEHVALDTLEAALEVKLEEVFLPEYKSIVQAARDRLSSTANE
ncbi:hypothetical protein [Caulobacter endophyticus]|uniref:Uncharacterized protein n=1 Tax=Caulobacter endophyticus TaxID=2172652 RepID=A0A2T9JMF8_9CAUL|nr:hypothetical protein [Caulobacter endophyticus]PVM84872.1 hypothetical protein DDF67_18405 [Caulobacter endophyticus]